jgi:hypothetical protein
VTGAFVDLGRYPIAELDVPAGAGLVASARDQLDEEGIFLLPGFLRPSAVDAIVAEVQALRPQAYLRETPQRLYPATVELDPRFAADHPLRVDQRCVESVLVYDLFGSASKLRELYEWDTLPAFLASVLQEPVYRCADPIVSVIVLVMEGGQEHGWHFDSNDYVVSIMLQRPHSGGEFEYVPMIRGADEEDYPAVEEVVRGSSDRVVSLTVDPGTLVVFRGRRSVHRVAPVSAGRERMIALLSYNSEPGFVFSDAIRIANAGRSVPLALSS